MKESIPCNCFHSIKDHKDFGNGEFPFMAWCIFSEYGACPCDSWTPMTNLEYLDYKYGQMDSKSSNKGNENISKRSR